MKQGMSTLHQAVVAVLEEFGPTHYRKLTEEILRRGLAVSSSKSPEQSVSRILSTDIKHNGQESEFIRIKSGVYGLRTLHATGSEAEDKAIDVSPNHRTNHQNQASGHSRRVRIPYFPTYREVRHLLVIWSGRSKSLVAGLHSTLAQLRGTPQNPVNWTDPDTWIPEKLSGGIHDLAMAIWTKSNRDVNPRHTYGHWLLVQQYDLLQADSNGKLLLTDHGRDFINHQGGPAEMLVDRQEGLLELLTMVSESESVQFGGLVDVWAEYLDQCSGFRTESTIRDTLGRRLKNLLDRGLISREYTKYSITKLGNEYLKRSEISCEPDERQQIRKLSKRCELSVKRDLLDYLQKMDPTAFERLIGHLLEKMNYQNVEVFGRSGDGGVDVIAEIKLGITSVREVVQAKRHRQTVQRKVLDALRGSLHRFDAVRGTIVTTSRFSKGTVKEASSKGAAPITLIDGDKLVNLLIEHGIGIHKRVVEVLATNLDELSEFENLEEE